jgi:serine/threonine protein kinase
LAEHFDDNQTLSIVQGSGGRYEILGVLGRGGQGRLFLACDLDSGARVAVKQLAMRAVSEWKAVELFEREGKVLRSLEHPAIPSYIDHFVVGEETDDPRFYLVQEYVEGDSLAARLEAGPTQTGPIQPNKTWTQDEAVDFLEQMLDVLAYLGELHPPIVHRDIKPANIVCGPNGRYALVDFGAVQAIVPKDVGGSTVVGTSGYLPVEQIMGRAQPCSDLYALGATVVHMMSGVHPVELCDGGLEIDFAPHIEASQAFGELLADMLAPYPEDRIASAREALARLRELAVVPADGFYRRGYDKTSKQRDDALDAGESPAERLRLVRGRSTLARRLPDTLSIRAEADRLVVETEPTWRSLGFDGRMEITRDELVLVRRWRGRTLGTRTVRRDRLFDVIAEFDRIKVLEGTIEHTWTPLPGNLTQAWLCKFLRLYLALSKEGRSLGNSEGGA